ncbi:MAG: phosphate ABC transporter substrate-binding protein [Alphaproteobacteria bacterium]|nr:phosphate ABC transporter substrate-binding protein [Alphaproteobacteria bacterium]
MTIGRRLFMIGGGAAAVVFLGGATTSLDFGSEHRQSLLIAGSEEFAPYATKLADAFAKANPHVDVVVEAGGTVPGLLALARGAIDLALASRELTPSEDDKLTRSHLVARDAIGLVVNPANPLSGLTRKEAFAILREGKAPLRLYRRKPDAATQKAVDKLVLDHAEMAPGAIIVDSGAAMRDKIAADPDGIGFLALHDVTPAVKVLAIDNVAMSRATILSGRYPFTRSFFCVTHGTRKGAATDAFLAFAMGREGQALFETMGLIAVR